MKERVEQSFVVIRRGKDKIISGPYPRIVAPFIAEMESGVAVNFSTDTETKVTKVSKLQGEYHERKTD